VIRIAAAGDLHAGPDSVGRIRPGFDDLRDHADALLLAGDLTRTGTRDEAAVLAGELAGISIPVVAVLGNHDVHSDDRAGVTAELEGAGVTVLERSSHALRVGGTTVAVVGAKGFGGGFVGASGSEFGEPEMKSFMRATRSAAEDVQRLLATSTGDYRIALFHYAPVRDTVQGEPPEIFPFLGSYLLGEAADVGGADLVVHGHAHRGAEWGTTAGGVRVRNVAQAVLRRPYVVFNVGGDHPADEPPLQRPYDRPVSPRPAR
jgi:Icc-related predicted phosphoesterase